MHEPLRRIVREGAPLVHSRFSLLEQRLGGHPQLWLGSAGNRDQASSQIGELSKKRTNPLEMEVIGRETSNVNKRLPAEDFDVFSFPLNEAARTQVLDNPVSVDGGHTGRVSYVGLCP